MVTEILGTRRKQTFRRVLPSRYEDNLYFRLPKATPEDNAFQRFFNNQTVITSKGKRQAFGEFGDVYEEAYGADGRSINAGMDKSWVSGTVPPATFLVPLLHPHFLAEDGEGLSNRYTYDRLESDRGQDGPPNCLYSIKISKNMQWQYQYRRRPLETLPFLGCR